MTNSKAPAGQVQRDDDDEGKHAESEQNKGTATKDGEKKKRAAGLFYDGARSIRRYFSVCGIEWNAFGNTIDSRRLCYATARETSGKKKTL